MASSNQSTPTKVGILSLGDMGAGIARLLIAHGFPVATNGQNRRYVDGNRKGLSMKLGPNYKKMRGNES